MIPRIFRLQKPRQFTYHPVFYDRTKEAREKREKTILAQMGEKKEGDYVPVIQKGSFRHFHGAEKRNPLHSSVGLYIILILICLLAYFLFFR